MRRVILTLAVATLVFGALATEAQVRKYVRYEVGGEVSYGLLEGDSIQPLSGGLFDSPQPRGEAIALADVRLLAPVEPPMVLAVGLNYQSHLGDRDPAAEPGIFLKTPRSIIGPGEAIVIPKGAQNVHYEAELVIVIGKKTKGVTVEEAPDHIFGITAGNDVSARAWQSADLQWFRGKAIDTFGPIGPAVVTGLDYSDLLLTGRLNGEQKQESSTELLIFNIPEIVSFISRYITLEAGDVIFTGTPGRTSAMKSGDVFEVELEGVGVLSNPVVAER